MTHDFGAEMSANDYDYMARALRLAVRGQYSARPNPMVGCVLVAAGKVVGEGWHERSGEGHAEVNALRAAGDLARGATAYVTLEPCAHHGRTPPCAEALIRAGVAKVVIAMRDPFPQVAGRGVQKLQAAGIDVAVGLVAAAAETLNEGFVSRVTRGRPFVRLKLASSLDGAMAMENGESQWITGPDARTDVQRMRARCGAIMTGIGTALADDPSLNVRQEELVCDELQPLRVVLDSQLQLPSTARMLALPGSTLLCCAVEQRNEERLSELQQAGAEVVVFGADQGHVAVHEVLTELAAREVNDVLVEAGPVLAGTLLQLGLVDELVIYQAPHIMGSQTLRLAATPSWSALADRMELNVTDVRKIGADTRITARPKHGH